MATQSGTRTPFGWSFLLERVLTPAAFRGLSTLDADGIERPFVSQRVSDPAFVAVLMVLVRAACAAALEVRRCWCCSAPLAAQSRAAECGNWRHRLGRQQVTG